MDGTLVANCCLWPRGMKCPVREDEQEPGVPSLDQEDPRGGSGSPLKSSCLENPMDRGARWGYSPWGRKESDTTERRNNSSTKQNEGARTSKAPTGQPGAQACAAGAAATVLKLPKAEVSIGSCRLPDYMLEYTNFITIFYVTVRKFSRVGAILLKYLYL